MLIQCTRKLMILDIVISHLGCNIINSELVYGVLLRPSPEMLWPDVAILQPSVLDSSIASDINVGKKT